MKSENTLKELYEKIKVLNSSKDNFKELIHLMNSIPMRNMFQDYLKRKKEEFTIDDINLLGVLLEACNSIYNYSGESTGLTDSEYDQLLATYDDLAQIELSITTGIKAEGKVAHHKFPSLRGSLKKIYKITDEDILKNKSQKSLEDWVKSSQNKILNQHDKHVNLWEEEVMVFPKFDGVSCIFEFDKEGNLQRALTRGYTLKNEAQDITHIFEGVDFSRFVNNPGYEYGLKTEIMMYEKDLESFNEEYNKDYKNTRSIVSSILNSDEKDVRVNYLQIIPLRVSYLTSSGESDQVLADGVYNFPYLKCKLKEVEKIHDFAFANRYVNHGLRCDGAVIYLTNPELHKLLGRENDKNNFEVAFKYTEETDYSVVKDITFTAGLFGVMTPVVYVKPVKMKGNEIRKASLGSYARFRKLGLAKGDKVKITYDIIPYVDFDVKDSKCERSGKSPIDPPFICPDCHQKLEIDKSKDGEGTILRCVNKNCPCRVKGKILNYIQKLRIEGISFATIDDFYDLGFVKSIEDLYSLKDKMSDLVNIPGYGKKSIKMMIKQIDEKRDITQAELLGALGIEGISTKTFRKMLTFISYKEIIDYSLDPVPGVFEVIPGIKEKTANKIIAGIRVNEDLIKFLEKELNVREEKLVQSDFKVVFTKVRPNDFPELELEQFIEEAGGSIEESVTKDTNIVVVPNLMVTSGKINKANSYDIPIVPIEDLKEYIKNKYL